MLASATSFAPARNQTYPLSWDDWGAQYNALFGYNQVGYNGFDYSLNQSMPLALAKFIIR